MQPDQSPSLYDRLGGVYNVATVVDDLIDRVMSGPRLNSNPAVDEGASPISSSGSSTWSQRWCATRLAARCSTPDGRWVTPTDTSVSPGRRGRVRGRPAPGPCRDPRAPGGAVRAGRHRGEHERGHRPRPGTAIRAITPVAAGASAAVASPARCHPGPLGHGSPEPARTRQPRHVGSPRRGSLGRRTQSEEG
jgi:hypothetical protein